MICRTLEENIRRYKWTYGPDLIKAEVRDADGKITVPAIYLPYPPHALWKVDPNLPPQDQANLPPHHERKEMEHIFDPTILESVQAVMKGDSKGADQLYFRLPSEKDLEGKVTLRGLADANQLHFKKYHELKKAGKVDPKLIPLFKNNIGV
jgi:hypothetical protein